MGISCFNLCSRLEFKLTRLFRGLIGHCENINCPRPMNMSTNVATCSNRDCRNPTRSADGLSCMTCTADKRRSWWGDGLFMKCECGTDWDNGYTKTEVWLDLKDEEWMLARGSRSDNTYQDVRTERKLCDTNWYKRLMEGDNQVLEFRTQYWVRLTREDVDLPVSRYMGRLGLIGPPDRCNMYWMYDGHSGTLPFPHAYRARSNAVDNEYHTFRDVQKANGTAFGWHDAFHVYFGNLTPGEFRSLFRGYDPQ